MNCNASLDGHRACYPLRHRCCCCFLDLAPAPRRSILYQRGIYPPENFTPVAKYGLSVLVTSDEGLKTYLVQVLRQLAGEVVVTESFCLVLLPWYASDAAGSQQGSSLACLASPHLH